MLAQVNKVKQPGETKRYVLDFVPFLDTMETLASMAATISQGWPVGTPDPDPCTLTASIQQPNATSIAVYVAGGSTGFSHKVRVRGTTNQGRTEEVDLLITVQEIG